MVALNGARGVVATAGHLTEAAVDVETVTVRPLAVGCGVVAGGWAGDGARARCRAPGSGPRPVGSSAAGGTAGGPGPGASRVLASPGRSRRRPGQPAVAGSLSL